MWASPCLPALSVSPALPPVSKWCPLLLLPAHSWPFSGCFVLGSILLQAQLSSSLSLHVFLRLPNSFGVITSQSQNFVPHFPHAISQNWGTQKSCISSTLFDSFFLYLFLIHFFFFFLWSEIPLFCATLVFGRVTASSRCERKATKSFNKLL